MPTIAFRSASSSSMIRIRGVMPSARAAGQHSRRTVRDDDHAAAGDRGPGHRVEHELGRIVVPADADPPRHAVAAHADGLDTPQEPAELVARLTLPEILHPNGTPRLRR